MSTLFDPQSPYFMPPELALVVWMILIVLAPSLGWVFFLGTVGLVHVTLAAVAEGVQS
jgi:hypothetical protein